MSPATPTEEQWKLIEQEARNIVSSETRLADLPFQGSLTSDPSSKLEKKVYAHYFPALPLTINNKDAGNDYYAKEYLTVSGESGKHSKTLGYLRDRPLPFKSKLSAIWPFVAAAVEIIRAETIGIDGFFIDLLQISKGRFYNVVKVIFITSDRISPKFKLIPQPDMAALNVTPQALCEALLILASFRSTLRLQDGSIAIAPFAVDLRDQDFWNELATRMADGGKPITYWSVLLDYTQTSRLPEHSRALSMWGPREVNDVGKQVELISEFATSTGRQWLMPIVPQDERPKVQIFWESNNTELFRSMWMSAIQKSANAVLLITWNDFSENTQVCPSLANQFTFYDLILLYSTWFKSGHQPPIQRDALIYSHRRGTLQAELEASPSMKHMGSEPLLDNIEVIFFLIEPAVVEIELDGFITRRQGETGLTILNVKVKPGKPIYRILRNESLILEKIDDWGVALNVDRSDFAYLGGSSYRNFHGRDFIDQVNDLVLL